MRNEEWGQSNFKFLYPHSFVAFEPGCGGTFCSHSLCPSRIYPRGKPTTRRHSARSAALASEKGKNVFKFTSLNGSESGALMGSFVYSDALFFTLGTVDSQAQFCGFASRDCRPHPARFPGTGETGIGTKEWGQGNFQFLCPHSFVAFERVCGGDILQPFIWPAGLAGAS